MLVDMNFKYVLIRYNMVVNLIQLPSDHALCPIVLAFRLDHLSVIEQQPLEYPTHNRSDVCCLTQPCWKRA